MQPSGVRYCCCRCTNFRAIRVVIRRLGASAPDFRPGPRAVLAVWDRSAGPLRLPAGDNSAYLARWAAALASRASPLPKNKARYQNSPSGYPRNDRFAPEAALHLQSARGVSPCSPRHFAVGSSTWCSEDEEPEEPHGRRGLAVWSGAGTVRTSVPGERHRCRGPAWTSRPRI